MTRHTTADRLVALLGIRPIRGGSEDGPRDPWREKIEAELKEYFPGEERRIENAAERFRAQAARLLRPDGSRLYSDQEHEQRAAALLAEYDETGAAVTEEIDRAVAEAQAELVKLEGSDPLDALTEAELARANARRAFVSEDAEALPAHQLAPRVRAVLAGDDKAELVLWARYLARRFEKTAGPERGDLAPLVRDLGERLADPKAREKRKRLERRIEIGQAVEGPDRPGAQRARRPGRGGPRRQRPASGRQVLRGRTVGKFGGRIADLERRLGGDGCPECGWGSGKPVSFVAARTRGRDEPFDPKPCPTCGRPTVFTLRLGETDLRDGEG